jgi:dihydrofolate synthase / folylpolyglutamate synthase
MMNYNKALSYINERLPMYQRVGHAAYKTGLGNTLLLDEYFHEPHRHFYTVHVAGTNGKGSVSHMLASILQESGYKTGLYTSPHLLDFRERIRINGRPVTKKFVTSFIAENRTFFETISPSFFEISVFMAFEYFRLNKVDIAVTEVGLGGRLDSTNIITPVLSVITNIGRDHTEFLGNTLAEIAREKAGIIKPGVPVVEGETHAETRPVFEEVSGKNGSVIRFADDLLAIGENHMSGAFRVMKPYSKYGFSDDAGVIPEMIKSALTGDYQKKNIVTVLASAGILHSAGFNITKGSVSKGISRVIVNTGLMGRWQVIGHNPEVICDTAHNLDGIREVMKQAGALECRKLHLVMGFVSDKDVRSILKLVPAHAECYFCRLSVPRTMQKDVLMEAVSEAVIKGKYFESAGEAYENALQNTTSDDVILITGSNFCVADFMEYQKRK